MPFPNKVKEETLVKSRRCCCICNEFAGVYVNVHHIVPESKKGPNTIENAIVLCLKCHGEVGHYNEKHPIGKKYSVDELKNHRDNWWEWCHDNPSVPLPKNPVSVSPSRIELGHGEWRTKSLLNIYNKEERFYYQVCVKIGTESNEVQLENIGIKPIKGANDLKLQVNNIEVDPSVIRMLCIDQADNKVILLIIRSIEPHGVCTFEIQQPTSPSLSSEKTHGLTFAISSFSEEPAASGESSTGTFINFKPPEPITVLRLAMLLRRI